MPRRAPGNLTILSWLSPRAVRTIVALLAVITHRGLVFGADLEPVLTETEAVAGLPLVMPVRLIGSGPPPRRITLRFPDGQEVSGDVAAVRLVTPAVSQSGWLEAGPAWEVLSVSDGMRTPETVAWFVLADLPRGVVGQEIWIGGRPVKIRWLSRPAVLAMRLGFDVGGGGRSPLSDPWMSPMPEPWRMRADLQRELEPARLDPLRAWRATLATDGLYPVTELGGVGVTPDLLDSGIVEAVGNDAPIGDRLLDAVSAQTAARWRMALARLWAADAALSIRVRHALAGGGEFIVGSAESDRVVAPVWTAGPREAEALLAIMLEGDAPLAERATAARAWLDALPDAALWVIDDGDSSAKNPIAATLGAMRFAAGDGGAIPMQTGPEIVRPTVLTTRTMKPLRPIPNGAGLGRAVYRIGGTNRAVQLASEAAALNPPGIVTGPFASDWMMGGLIGTASTDGLRAPGFASSDAPSMVVTVDGGRPGGAPRCALLLTIPARGSDSWECRIWLGPYGRTRAVVIADSDGETRIQSMPGAGDRAPDLPRIERAGDASSQRLEITLPSGAAESDGLVHVGVEVVRGDGTRSAWPRPMLPWQIEPGRRIMDPTAWFGDLGP